MDRKVVSPEIVVVLDARVPREITDEILKWVVWRRELRDLKKIMRRDRYDEVVYEVGGVHYTSIWCKRCGRPTARSLRGINNSEKYYKLINFCDGWTHRVECTGYGKLNLEYEWEFGRNLWKFWKGEI